MHLVASSLSPLIMHSPHASETHYFPLNDYQGRRILLHTHGSAPFLQGVSPDYGLSFVIYSSGVSSCNPEGLTTTLDVRATLGRWALRYFTALASWCVGIVAIVMLQTWRQFGAGQGRRRRKHGSGRLHFLYMALPRHKFSILRMGFPEAIASHP